MSMEKITYTVDASPSGHVCRVRMIETVDQDFGIPVQEIANCASVTMDFSPVRFMNSEGLRQFTSWLWELEKANPKISVRLVKVSPTVNRQLLTVKTYLAAIATVESVYLPYYCEDCDREESSVLTHASELKTSGLPELEGKAPKCPECGGETQFDGQVDRYFELLISRKS